MYAHHAARWWLRRPAQLPLNPSAQLFPFPSPFSCHSDPPPIRDIPLVLPFAPFFSDSHIQGKSDRPKYDAS